MSETHISQCGNAAEVVLSVCFERGLSVKLHKPEMNADTRLEITAPDRKTYRDARSEWTARLYGPGREAYYADTAKRVSRTRL